MRVIARVSEQAGVAAFRLERTDPLCWRSSIEAELAHGGRFLGLYALAGESDPEVRAAFAGEDAAVVSTPAIDGHLPSIIDIIPAANWDEREAHDLFGVAFDGHEPLRPLVEHDQDIGRWVVPVRGHDPYQVAVGPIHAGIIESGHFRFHVVGDRILHVDLRLFYKHRGLERAAENSDATAGGIAYAQRACGGCAVSNSVAYAHAVESAMGLWPDDQLANIRTVLLELERLWNYLNDISAICAGVAFAPGTMAFAALKERALRLNREIGGHRFLFDTVAVATSPVSIRSKDARRLREALSDIRADAARYWRELHFNSSVQSRLGGVGALSRDRALRLGTAGPAARASSVAFDCRQDSPRLSYTDFTPTMLSLSGDVAGRLQQRVGELATTFELLDDLLERPLYEGQTTVERHSAPLGIGRTESPRGETVCVVELDGSRVGRLHLRSGSYANWPSLAAACAGNLLPDFPLINKSFELCYACCDR